MLIEKVTLSKEECELLIETAKPNIERHWRYNAAKEAYIDKRVLIGRATLTEKECPSIYSLYKKVFEDLPVVILNEDLSITMSQYLKGHSMFAHTDVSYEVNKLTYVASVVLNADFEGGEFISYYPSRDTPIIMKSLTGNTSIMGSSVFHEVKHVLKGERWSAQFRLTSDNSIPKTQKIL
jgi:hypothetical protein